MSAAWWCNLKRPGGSIGCANRVDFAREPPKGRDWNRIASRTVDPLRGGKSAAALARILQNHICQPGPGENRTGHEPRCEPAVMEYRLSTRIGTGDPLVIRKGNLPEKRERGHR